MDTDSQAYTSAQITQFSMPNQNARQWRVKYQTSNPENFRKITFSTEKNKQKAIHST